MLLFLLVFAVRISLLFVFSHEEYEDMPLSRYMILFRIFRFFGSEEPVWSEITIRFGFLPQKRTPTVAFIVWATNGCWPSLEIIFGLAPNLCQFQRPRCWESISPENSRSKIRLPSRLIDSTSRILLLLVHKIGHDSMELRLVNFSFFFFINSFYISYTCVECSKELISYFASSSSYSNTFLVMAFAISQKHCFKNANFTLQPAAHASSGPAAPGAILDTFPCEVNVFLFTIVLSFYWVLILSGTEGRHDFLPTVYWEIKINNTVKTKR